VTLAVDPPGVRLVEAAIDLDLSRATGSIGLRLGAEPAVLANLAIDRLDVGAYWPRPRPPAGPAKATGEVAEAGDEAKRVDGKGGGAKTIETKDDTAKKDAAEDDKPEREAAKSEESKSDAPPPAPLPSWRGPVNAELELAVGTLVVDGHVLRETRFRGVLAKDMLTVERATFQDYEGLHGGVTGTIRALSGQPQLNLSFDVQAAELIDFVRLAGLSPPSTLAHAGPTLVRGTIRGQTDGLLVALRADAARGTLTVEGTVSPPLVDPHFNIGVEVKHPDASDLLPLLAGMVPPGVELEGPAAFATRLKG